MALQHRSVLRICKKRFSSRPAHWRRQTRWSPPLSARKRGRASRSFARARIRPRRSREGTARRRALDDALAEMDAGLKAPSSKWKVRYGLMLGLERVLAEPEPRTAAGTALRRHQVDALAGMLTELIAASQRYDEAAANGNGNGHAATAEELESWTSRTRTRTRRSSSRSTRGGAARGAARPTDPGAVRRYRFRHPTASGKTIAAAGFVEAARTLGVLILTHRRLLVSQFTRDLTTEGYADRFTRRDRDAARSRSAKKARSRSRRTPGSRATSTRSTATRTSSSSATRRTRRSARRRPPRSARSRSRSTSA